MQPIPDFVREKLNEDEEIVWMGNPAPMMLALKVLLEGLLFGLLFLFVAFRGFQVAFHPYDGELHIAPGTDIGLQIVIIAVLALIGLALLLKPFRAYKDAEKTTYCVSNQQAFQIIAKKKAKIISHSKGEIKIPERKNKRNGKSDIVYATRLYRGNRGQSRMKKYGFWAIDDGDGAENALLALKNKKSPTPSKHNEFDRDGEFDMRSLR